MPGPVKVAPPPPETTVGMWDDVAHEAIPSTARAQYLFSVEQLAIAFGSTRATIKKMIGDTEATRTHSRVGLVYDIGVVAQMIDVRKPKKDNTVMPSMPDGWLDDDGQPTMHMPPNMRRQYYQALDMEQSYLIKKAKNDLHERTSLKTEEVEKTAAAAYKVLVKHLDNLPDVFEREGIIESKDVHKVISKIDKMRAQLASDMAKLK